jgi:hypothetical protein
MSTNVPNNQEDQEIDLSKFQKRQESFPKRLVNRYIKAFGLL